MEAHEQMKDKNKKHIYILVWVFVFIYIERAYIGSVYSEIN
jgi:hypothetical protein